MNGFSDVSDINFDAENINELWNSENYFFSKYSINKNGIISMINANNSYMELNGYTEHNIGMSINEFKSDNEIASITNFFEMYKKELNNICFLTDYVYKDKHTLWKVYIRVDFPTMKCIGEKTNYIPSKHNCSENNTATMMVTKGNKCFYVDMFDDKMKNSFPKIKNGYSVNKLFGEKTVLMLELCLNCNKSIKYYDTFNNSIGKEENLYIVMSPFMHNGLNSVLVDFYAADCDFWSKDISGYDNSFGHLTDYSFFGFCLIDYKKDKTPCITDRNEFFLNLINRNEISLESIVCSPLFEYALYTKSPVCDRIIYQKDSKVYNYSLCVIPKFENNKLQNVLVTLIPENNSKPDDKKVFEKLTPRESDAINLVMKGYTNKYIAYQLKISEGTVKKILYNSYHKLGVKSRVEIVKMLYDDKLKHLTDSDN